MNFLDKVLLELIDIDEIVHDNEHINMVDLFIKDDESFILADGLVLHNSASVEIQSNRDPQFHAAFALTGVVNNVYNATPAQLLKMGKLTDLLTVLGLTPDVKATRDNINFGSIVISTDADPDGSSIMTILVNMLYKFWPDLFKGDTPIVYRLMSPNLVAYNKKERVYFSSMVEFKKVEKQYKNHTIVYYKGLGSMTSEDWIEILGNVDKYTLPIVYDEDFDATMKLLFSDDADSRKHWLMS